MSNNKLAQVFHFDLQGKRDDKYNFLTQNSLASIAWNTLEPNKPNFFFVKKNFEESGIYETGFKIDELFGQNSSGVETRKDSLVIDLNEDILKSKIIDFQKLSINEIAKKYNLNDESRDWKIEWAKNDLIQNNPKILNTLYKPFDLRKIIYTGKSKGINGYPMYANFKHFILGDNLGLCLMKKIVNTIDFKCLFITNTLMDKNFYGFQTYTFPLYVYPETSEQLTIGENTNERKPNLNQEIVDKIAKGLSARFVAEKDPIGLKQEAVFSPIDILDYIYAVLHSPTYREKYKEFLKIDFPRVPYPKDKDTFWQLVKLGGEIRQIHLLESPAVEKYITQYPEDGNNLVTKPKYENGKVFINDTQYFENVPEVAWTFFIGGYQPAQKWLKDRKDRKLEFDDILHYQKIIVALSETDRLMKEIDKIEIK